MIEPNKTIWDFLGAIYSTLPTWLKITSIITIIIIAVSWIYLKYTKNNDCEEVVVIGVCLDRATKQPLNDCDVFIDNANSNLNDFTKIDGSFKLEGITMPKSKIVTLIVKDRYKSVLYEENININNKMKYTLTDCQLDLHYLYLDKTYSHQNDSITPVDEQDKITFNCNLNYKTIIEDISNHSNLQYDVNSKYNQIMFSTTGNIIQAPHSNNLYKYTGGFVTIKIDNIVCLTLTNIEILPSINAGNDFNATDLYINKQMDEIIKLNYNAIIENILACLEH